MFFERGEARRFPSPEGTEDLKGDWASNTKRKADFKRGTPKRGRGKGGVNTPSCIGAERQ